MLKDSLSDPRRLQECADELEIRGFSQAADTGERFIPGLLNYRSAPKDHWRRIRTTNILERLNQELNRRSRTMGAFSNDASLLRPAGTILMDSNEEWIKSRRYLSGSDAIVCQDTSGRIYNRVDRLPPLWIQDLKLQRIRDGTEKGYCIIPHINEKRES